MNDRDRLVELLEDSFHEWEINDVQNKTIQEISEHLIENGVIVPPCEVGDTVYYPFSGRIITKKIICFVTYPTTTVAFFNAQLTQSCEIKDFGKTVFLTREAAEQALKEREV